jgi:hypothetical protein
MATNGKRTISKEEWEKKLKQVKINKQYVIISLFLKMEGI